MSIFEEPLNSRKGKATPVAKASIIGDRETVARTVTRTPEVMIKIASHAKDRTALANMVDYIARLDAGSREQGKEPVTIEDENGDTYLGEHARKDALYTWRGIPAKSHTNARDTSNSNNPPPGQRREAFHVVFSMPDGTNPDDVRTAVKRLAAVEFKRFQYVFARHDDGGQAHTHLIVHATPHTGKKRLSPGRTDLQRWRETFAENLRRLGVEANATPRAARFVLDYARNSKLIQRDERQARERGESPLMVEKRRPVVSKRSEAYRERIESVLNEYRSMAMDLIKGDSRDKELSWKITQFVREQAPLRAPEQGRVLPSKDQEHER